MTGGDERGAHRPPASLKATATQLAELLATAHGRRSTALMDSLGFFARAEQSAADSVGPSTSADAAGDQIGIWSRTVESDGIHWLRREPGAPFLWADVARIPPKGARKRVVWLGESVARGWFYDPHYSPAGALQDLLGRAVPDTGFEVVDLACCGADMNTVLELAQSSLALAPDALVVFAGNNWRGLTENDGSPEWAQALEKGGFPALRDLMNSRLERGATHFVDSVAGIAEGANIPVVFILPEFNLLDWRSPPAISAPPWLPGDRNERWHTSHEAAKEAMANGDHERGAALAAELMVLDEGLCGLAPRILGHRKRAEGDLGQARRLFETAKDANVLGWPDSPRCFTPCQSAIRTRTAELGLPLVDLPVRFERRLDGDLPDRTLFLDFCHLSADGLRVTVAATAELLLQALGVEAPDGETLEGLCPTPSAEVEAVAHLLAAAFGCNMGQKQDLLVYHCREALAKDPSLRSAMGLLLDFQSRAGPNVLSGSYRDFHQGERVGGDRSPLFLSWGAGSEKNLYLNLSLAMLDALDDPTDRARWEALVRREWRLGPEGASVLEQSGWCGGRSHSALTLNEATWSGTHYREKCRTDSDFFFIADEGAALEIDLTIRVPWLSATDEVSLTVNGEDVGSVRASAEWRDARIGIPRSIVQDGLNVVVLSWPIAPYDGDKGLAGFTDRVLLGYPLETPHPVVGEIHALRVSPAPDGGD